MVGITGTSGGARLSTLIVDGDLNMGPFDITFTSGNIIYLDLPMRDYKCGTCGKEFKVNNVTALKIRKILKGKKYTIILQVPIHIGCIHKKFVWKITDEYPELKVNMDKFIDKIEEMADGRSSN